MEPTRDHFGVASWAFGKPWMLRGHSKCANNGRGGYMGPKTGSKRGRGGFTLSIPSIVTMHNEAYNPGKLAF